MDSVGCPAHLDNRVELVLDVWCEGHVYWLQRAG